jgi:hypothetical protein
MLEHRLKLKSIYDTWTIAQIMFGSRRKDLTLFFVYLNVVFCSARKIFCYFLEYKNGTFRDFAVSGCRILRTIQKTKFEYLKLKSSDEKPNFSAYFC